MADIHLLSDPANQVTKTKKEEENDIISNTIGNFGKWQLKQTFLLSLFNICCTFHIFSPTFLALPREVWCARPNSFRNIDPETWKNFTQPDGYCTTLNIEEYNITPTNFSLIPSISGIPLIKCTHWEFEGQWSTLISYFSLLCDRKTLNNLSDMMFLAGVAVGGLVCGIISDKYGRKKTLMACVLLQTLIGVALAFTPWFELYIILRAALGFISVSVVFSGFVLTIEIVGGRWRTISGISYLLPVSVSYMMTAGIAYFIRDWRYLQLTLSAPGVLYLALWWVIPESPRWLLAMDRQTEVRQVLEIAAKANGRELPTNLDKLLLPISKVETENVSVMDLFRTKQMRKKTLLLTVAWFVMYLVYYGLVLNLNSIGGNVYVNTVIFALVEIPAIGFSIFMLLKRGRRWPLAMTMIVSGVASSCNIATRLFAPDLQWPVISFSMISKLCISSSNVMLPIFTAELFPTTIRNIGVGTCNVPAGVALMLVPFLWRLGEVNVTLPWVVLGGFSVIGGTCILFLPETANRALVNTLQEERRATKLSIAGELQNVNNTQ